MKNLYDKKLPKWEDNPEIFKDVLNKISDKELTSSRAKEKKDLVDWINSNPTFFPFGELFDDDYFQEDVLTISFARRFVPYKRVDMIFSNLELLRKIGYKKIQIILSGKCHPDDYYCNSLMASLKIHAQNLRGQIRVVVIPQYNTEISKKLISGSDVWLNTPLPPMEACGTSGMKAALNGILNFSILDGWWLEGYESAPLSGWSIGEKDFNKLNTGSSRKDIDEMYEKLKDIIDCYYNRKEEWIERTKHSISLASFFNTHRMINEYYEKMWDTD